VALVHLGETQYVDEAVKELKSSDAMDRHYAVWKLARFKTRESYRKLYELLDDNTNRDHDPFDGQNVLPLSWVTIEVLLTIEKDPPKVKERHDTEGWKAWFVKNKLVE
jgi:hypothetical protein